MYSFTDIPIHIRAALTPQMRLVVERQLDRLTHEPQAATVTESRAAYLAEREFWNVGGPAMHATQNHTFEVSEAPVRVRVYRPSDAEILPAIVYFHGGAFMLGDLDSHDRITRELAQSSGAAVVAVDYSLAPEARYPKALLECAGVIAHLALHGDRYGIDGGRLAVAGDSAGAILALGATLLLRDEPGLVPETAADPQRPFAALTAMLLYYGQYGLADSQSKQRFGGFWDGMSPDDLALAATTYFQHQTDYTHPYASPLLANLDGPLPPAYLVGAALDPFKDDTEALDERLRSAGHEVECRIVPGVLHAFLHYGRMLDDATAAIDGGGRFARSHLER